MMRRMCKKCTEKDNKAYVDKSLTGEVVKREIRNERTVTTLKCTTCGHEWSYKRKIHY
jgi:hypothetical protein